MFPFRHPWFIPVMLSILLGLDIVSVYACSVSEDYNPVAESSIIVAGRLTSWQRLQPDSTSGFIPIRVQMQVDHVVKGHALQQVVFVDRTSLQHDSAGKDVWVGSGGACGMFDTEPTNTYVILGLFKQPDGTYTSNRVLIFYAGTQPKGEEYERALAQINTFAAHQLPHTGVPDTREVPTTIIVVAFTFIAGGFLMRGRCYIASRL